MNALRNSRHLAIVPALLWLIAQFVMTGFIAIPANASVKAVAGDSAIETLIEVIICTPSGLKTISLGSEESPESDESGARPDCRWCQTFGHAPDIQVATFIEATVRFEQAHQYRVTNHSVIANQQFVSGFRSRAPPI